MDMTAGDKATRREGDHARGVGGGGGEGGRQECDASDAVVVL
jgi:hypothetical protein